MKKHIILAVLALAACLSASAQYAVQEYFKEVPIDLSSVLHPRKDKNGRKCALVKVQVVADSVTFSHNVVGEVRGADNEYWVYLTPGTRYLIVNSSSFSTMRCTFKQAVKEGLTYELRIYTPFTASSAPTIGGTHEVEVEKFERDSFASADIERLDLHKKKCALVKVSVDADSVNFQGNIVGPVTKNGYEYSVYLSDGTKYLKILSPAFLPLLYKFPEPMESNATYTLTLCPIPDEKDPDPRRDQKNRINYTGPFPEHELIIF